MSQALDDLRGQELLQQADLTQENLQMPSAPVVPTGKRLKLWHEDLGISQDVKEFHKTINQ